MRVIVHAKNMVLTEPLRAYTLDKFSRLEHLLPYQLQQVDVGMTLERARGVEARRVVRCRLIGPGGFLMHGEERAADMHVAVDALYDTMKRRLQRYRMRLESRRQGPFARDIWPAIGPERPER